MLLRVFDDKASLRQGRLRNKQQAPFARAISEHGRASNYRRYRGVPIRVSGCSDPKVADIDWARVEAFHLDEYVGLPIYASRQLSQDAGGSTRPVKRGSPNITCSTGDVRDDPYPEVLRQESEKN